MPEGLERRYGEGHLHFVTFSCHERLPLLGTIGARDRFVKILGEVRDRYEFSLVGYVVMPEHVHLLISEPVTGTPSTVMQALKQTFSHQMHGKPSSRMASPQPSVRFNRPRHSLPRIWQPRFYDFNVWSQKKKIEKLQYIHMNPVKRGLVTHPKDWPWSSFSFYASRDSGLIALNPE